MIEVNFSSFQNKFVGGTAVIVGKGPTTFDYSRLSELNADLYVFLNDAVQFESNLAEGTPSFLFFLDDHQAQHWFKTPVRSVMVSKDEHRKFSNTGVRNRCIFYKHVMGQVPQLSRSKLSEKPQLCLKLGTVSPVLHWLWFVGVRNIKLIGCDGLNNKEIIHRITGGSDYDPRIKLHLPGKCGWVNASIRESQDTLIEIFGFNAEYLGTPELPPAAPVKFISFCTPNYEPLLRRMEQSAKSLGLDIYTELMPDSGNWIKNTCQKPVFIRKVMDIWVGRRLCWVDADAVFRLPPKLVLEMPDDVDIAYALRGKEVLSGTVYIGATPNARKLVHAWCEECDRAGLAKPDGQTLVQALTRVVCRVRVLPPEYTYIFDISKREHPGVEPVIEHMQASREVRAGKPVVLRGAE